MPIFNWIAQARNTICLQMKHSHILARLILAKNSSLHNPGLEETDSSGCIERFYNNTPERDLHSYTVTTILGDKPGAILSFFFYWDGNYLWKGPDPQCDSLHLGGGLD